MGSCSYTVPQEEEKINTSSHNNKESYKITIIYNYNSNINASSESNRKCPDESKIQISSKTNKEVITLFCVYCNDGNSIKKSIIIQKNATILQLKESISRLFNFELDEFRLYISSFNFPKPINRDHLNLIDYGITNGITLRVWKNLNFRERSVMLEVCGYNTIQHVINYLLRCNSFKAENEYFPTKAIQLFDTNNSSLLSRNKTLYESNIKPNAVILAKYPALKVPFCDDNDITLIDENLIDFKYILDHFNKCMKQYNAKLIHLYRINKGCTDNMQIFNAILKTKENKLHYELYHGTSFENAGKIIKYGFNRDYNQRSRYGYGTYLAVHPAKASRYCRRYNKHIAIYCMLLCKTIIGNMVKGVGCKERVSLVDNKANIDYDSLVDDVNNPSIFVINKDYHSVPTHFIVFRYKR